MGTIKTSIQMFDGMTPGLQSMTKALNNAVHGFEALERASSNCIDTRSLREGRMELNMTKSSFQQIQNSIREAGEQQNKFNKSMRTGAGLTGGMLGNQKKAMDVDTDKGTGLFGKAKGMISNQEKAKSILHPNSGKDLSAMGQQALGSTNIPSCMENSGVALGLGTGSEFPEENAKQAKSDKVNAAVDTLTSVMPQGFTSPDEMKNSMFAAADEIDTKFSGLSQVLGAVWSGATGEQTEAIKVSDLLADSWSSFAPIVMGVAAAMNLYNLAMEAGKVIQVLQAAATVIGAAFNKLWATSVEEQTAAQVGLNSAILTCPITWIIAGIILLIAIIFGAVAAFNKFTGASISATGIIAGVFGVLGAIIFNIFASLWNTVAIFVNFLANVFQNPIAAIQLLFYELAINVIGFIRKIAEGIETLLNNIPGLELDITSNLDSLLSELEKKSQNVKDKAGFEDVMQTLEYKDYGGAFKGGYDWGEGREDNFAGMLGGAAGNDGMDQLLQNASETAGNTAVMADSTEISQEDLRYLRDISERDAINRFTTAQVSVDFKNEATINSDMDIDGVMNKFTDVLREAIFTQAEEVHCVV